MVDTHKAASKFLVVCATAFVGASLLMLSLNYFVDRYYVFHPQSGVFEETLEPNTRVLKAHYLSLHCHEFNALIVGSSRDVAYLTRDVNRVFGVRAYNYSVASGNLRSTLAQLEWLETLDCIPGRVFLPVSIDRLKLPTYENDLLRMESPLVVATPAYWREFMLSYIGTDAVLSNLRKLAGLAARNVEPRFRYTMPSGDVEYLWHRDFRINGCPGEAIAADAAARQVFVDFLLRIKSLTDRHGAELTLLWNPLPIDVQLAYLQDAIALLLRLELDFDWIYRLPLSDSRMRNSNYYIDHGHFNAELGAAVLDSADHAVRPAALAEELEATNLACTDPVQEGEQHEHGE